MPFTNPWTESEPTDSTAIRDGDDWIRRLATAVRERFAVEHNAYEDELGKTDVGTHKPGSARAFIGLAANKPNPTTTPVGSLYFETDNQQLLINNGTSWLKVQQASAPLAHKESHSIEGSDYLTPDSIGAATPSQITSEISAHASEASAHHGRYTDEEAVNAVVVGGSAAGLNSDKVDGYDANDAIVAGTIPVRNADGKVPGSITGDATTVGGKSVNAGTTANTIPIRDADGDLPGDITGDAATVGGKAASAFLQLSGGNPTGTINFNAVSTARVVVPVGTDKWAT